MIVVAQWVLIVLFTGVSGHSVNHSLEIPFHSGVACDRAASELLMVRSAIFAKCYPLGDRETP